MIVNTNIGAEKDQQNELLIECEPPERWWLRKRSWIFAFVFTCLVLAFALIAGRILVVDSPQKSDVILILAGETDHRLESGLKLLDQGYARALVLDVPAEAKVYGFTEVQLAHKYIDGLPEREVIRICPIEGLSTKAESHDAEKCLIREEGNRVLIVTSEFHTRRARSVFRHEIRNRKFSIAASYDTTQFGTTWWRRRQWAKTCVDEWLRVVWWSLVDRWR